jgi:hypothetical protein
MLLRGEAWIPALRQGKKDSPAGRLGGKCWVSTPQGSRSSGATNRVAGYCFPPFIGESVILAIKWGAGVLAMWETRKAFGQAA